MNAENGISRRAALVKLGVFLNGIVGVFLAVPIVRYLLSPVIREKKFGYESWLSLGGLEQFPAGQTRLATYRNPVVNAWDGETADIACWVRNIDGQTFQVSRPTVRTLDAQFAGFRSRVSSCARATGALTTRTVRAPPVLPSAACSSTATKSRVENFSSRRAKCRPRPACSE